MVISHGEPGVPRIFKQRDALCMLTVIPCLWSAAWRMRHREREVSLNGQCHHGRRSQTEWDTMKCHSEAHCVANDNEDFHPCVLWICYIRGSCLFIVFSVCAKSPFGFQWLHYWGPVKASFKLQNIRSLPSLAWSGTLTLAWWPEIKLHWLYVLQSIFLLEYMVQCENVCCVFVC